MCYASLNFSLREGAVLPKHNAKRPLCSALKWLDAAAHSACVYVLAWANLERYLSCMPVDLILRVFSETVNISLSACANTGKSEDLG